MAAFSRFSRNDEDFAFSTIARTMDSLWDISPWFSCEEEYICILLCNKMDGMVSSWVLSWIDHRNGMLKLFTHLPPFSDSQFASNQLLEGQKIEWWKRRHVENISAWTQLWQSLRDLQSLKCELSSLPSPFLLRDRTWYVLRGISVLYCDLYSTCSRVIRCSLLYVDVARSLVQVKQWLWPSTGSNMTTYHGIYLVLRLKNGNTYLLVRIVYVYQNFYDDSFDPESEREE